MIANQVGKRYAEAIYDIANSKNNIKEVYEVLNQIMELYTKDYEFKTFITSPLIDVAEKKNVISKLFYTSNEDILHIVFYLLDKNRVDSIRDITVEYLKIYYLRNNILDVEATFATNPTKEQQEKLVKNLEIKTGKKVQLIIKIDKSIIGGGILKIGDTIMDGSIRKELDNIKKI